MDMPPKLISAMNVALPYVVGALVMATGYVVYDRYLRDGISIPFFSGTSSGNIVMVDVIRIVNAQNRLAVSSLGGDTEALTKATRAGGLIESTIRKVAGPGTIVLVKQGVVAPEESMVEITDTVLKELGLPLDAPTVDVVDRAQYTPGPATNFSGSPLEAVLDDAVRKRRADTGESIAKSRSKDSEAILP